MSRHTHLTAWFPVFASANAFDTDNRAWVPEVWAQESLMVLEENLVYANMVHRDFEDEIKEFGDVVNTRQPGKFTARRKTDGNPIVKQPATATKVAVPLDQHMHTSFIIYDGELSKSMKDLVAEYLNPAIHSLARQIDAIVDAQKYQFLGNTVGDLETAPTKTEVIALQTKMNQQIIPPDGRWCVITTNTQGDLLGEQQFTDADKFGDDGSAIREGSIGRLYGTNFVMSQNNKNIPTGNTVVTGAINAGNLTVGSTVLTVDGLSAVITDGSWCTIAGDMNPQMIESTAGGTTPVTLNIKPGLVQAIVDDAVVTIYTPGAIDLAAGYAAKYDELIVVDAFTVAHNQGQLVTLSATETDAKYGSLDMGKDAANVVIPRTTNLTVDRPLVAAVANNDVVGIGPMGNYNFAFHRNAIALVNRPLATVPPDMGARSAVVNFNNLSLRATLSYDAENQGILVTIDTLLGVKVLDTDLGCVFLAL